MDSAYPARVVPGCVLCRAFVCIDIAYNVFEHRVLAGADATRVSAHTRRMARRRSLVMFLGFTTAMLVAFVAPASVSVSYAAPGCFNCGPKLPASQIDDGRQQQMRRLPSGSFRVAPGLESSKCTLLFFLLRVVRLNQSANAAVNPRCRTLSIESGPGPWSARVMSAARYKRSSSYPTGPNWAPEAETLNSLTELNPYGRWTVTIAI
jgi:hypothetical protein